MSKADRQGPIATPSQRRPVSCCTTAAAGRRAERPHRVLLLRRATPSRTGSPRTCTERARAPPPRATKAAAADTLWRHDHRAEALALLCAALDEAVAAARLLARDNVDWASSLKAGGAPGTDIDAAAEAHRAAREEEAPPALDADVAPGSEARRAALVGGFEALDRALDPRSRRADESARRCAGRGWAPWWRSWSRRARSARVWGWGGRGGGVGLPHRGARLPPANAVDGDAAPK